MAAFWRHLGRLLEAACRFPVQPSTRQEARALDPMEIQSWLRRCGVVVHHAARMPVTADGRQSVVLFLETALHQHELARQCALRLPDVSAVQFSGHTQGVMYTLSEATG